MRKLSIEQLFTSAPKHITFYAEGVEDVDSVKAFLMGLNKERKISPISFKLDRKRHIIPSALHEDLASYTADIEDAKKTEFFLLLASDETWVFESIGIRILEKVKMFNNPVRFLRRNNGQWEFYQSYDPAEDKWYDLV